MIGSTPARTARCRGGKTGKTHELTQAVQGKYHYVYVSYADPVLLISPGDIVGRSMSDLATLTALVSCRRVMVD
jgi:hypothetical protein